MNDRLAVLERRSLTLLDPVEDTIDPLTAELARRAEKVLGYSVLGNEVRAKQRGVAKAQRPIDFNNTLHTLGIEPFSDDSVGDYKTQQLQKALGFLGPRPLLRETAWTFGWIVAVGCFWQFFAKMPALDAPNLSHWFRVQGAWYLGVATVLSILTVWLIHHARMSSRWQWVSVKLADYPEPVPAYVLDKAVAIKEQFPDTEFSVERLVYTEPERPPRTADPFLKVSHAKTSFYIEVWDEPKFEAKL